MLGLESISFIPYLLMLPIHIYGNWRLYNNHQSSMFIKKRSFSLTFGLNITFALMVITCLESQIVSIYNLGSFFLRIIPFILCWSLLLSLLICKNWLIYWRYKWQYYALQTNWQKIINSHKFEEQNDSNFYLKYNHKYGQRSYVTKICITATVVLFVFNLCFGTLNEFGYRSVAAIFGVPALLLFLSSAVIYGIIVCKTPYYKDVYFIHWESKMHAKLLLLFVVVSCIYVSSLFALGLTGTSYGQMILYPLVGVLFTVMAYVSTSVIIRKNTEGEQGLNVVQLSSVISESVNPALSITVEMILSHENSINLFMNHLSKEYVFVLQLWYNLELIEHYICNCIYIDLVWNVYCR